MMQERHRILLVDDDRDLLLALGIRMRQAGFEVSCATRGDEAAGVLREERPDLILLDIGLPGASGYEVLERLRRTPAGAAVPVIVVSAHDAERHAQRVREAGAIAFFQKPVDHLALFHVMREVLEPREAA